MAHAGLVPVVGIGYGLSYAVRVDGGAAEPLIFEAVSRPGAGRFILTGARGDALSHHVGTLAFEWAMANLDGIVQELGKVRSGCMLMGRARDVHVHVLNTCEGMNMSFYGPTMAIAMCSLLTGLQPCRDIIVSGGLAVHDLLLDDPAMIRHESHVEKMLLQGFRRLVVIDSTCVSDTLRELMRQRGLSLIVDEDDYTTFTSLLPQIFGVHSGLSEEDEMVI